MDSAGGGIPWPLCRFRARGALRPFQAPHPPVLVGSHGAAGLRRVVEYGDEWFPWFPDLTIDLCLEEDMRELARLCAGQGTSQPASRSCSASRTRL